MLLYCSTVPISGTYEYQQPQYRYTGTLPKLHKIHFGTPAPELLSTQRDLETLFIHSCIQDGLQGPIFITICSVQHL